MLTAAPHIVAARPSFGGRVVNRLRPINTMDGYPAREGTERPKRSAEDRGPAGRRRAAGSWEGETAAAGSGPPGVRGWAGVAGEHGACRALRPLCMKAEWTHIWGRSVSFSRFCCEP